MYRDQAVEMMKNYFNNERFVSHTLKVLGYAERILEGEGCDDEFTKITVALGSIFHDIGIPESMKKHSSMEAEYQEEEGPPVAREMMNRIGVRPDILERVCYIVGHHHTRGRIDGIDFKIIWEADFLVNLQEGNLTLAGDEIPRAVQENLRTQTGMRLVQGIRREQQFEEKG